MKCLYFKGKVEKKKGKKKKKKAMLFLDRILAVFLFFPRIIVIMHEHFAGIYFFLFI